MTLDEHGGDPTGISIYRKQRWHCTACGTSGLVLFHKSDSAELKRERLEQSHTARAGQRCPGPRIVRVPS